MLLWFKDLMSVTEKLHSLTRPNVLTLPSGAYIRGDLNTATRGARKKESNLDSNIMNWETNFNLIDLK